MTQSLLLDAARGKPVARPPVWMMRQAGRYMAEYRALRDKYGFKERCENPELAVEISLQPFRAFRPDGVIMFSDILTPFDGMGIPFELVESRGPVIDPPIRTREQVEAVRPLDPEASLAFVRTILQTLRREVGEAATVLGFVGAPWTLAAYAVEGKSSKDYALIKQMAFSEPDLLHALLAKFADAIARYVIFQIDSGAQAVQLFDTWAGQLNPADYRAFALPYERRIVEQVRQVHPETPLILYINHSAGLLRHVGESSVDVMSLDWTVDMAEARAILGPDMAVQGNLDPCVLLGDQAQIRSRILDITQKAGPTGHIMNLGHGILPSTPEENARFFFETVKSLAPVSAR
ncbi:MAG: uroporphyrinogen decarboxylase [Aphanocapsa lilacina HA4352-LM1]|nr:uroporphyrinogen decarboxylase [Aphanocapsa lilacina HA4352-LM1]